ncbi:ATP-binding protein [Natronorubrum texcoconense]|uniref:ATP-binding protein n=1 Tax=Natronorubrum texcoconense TaxID=1095776 RepID=UPI000B7D18DA|nr:ATP-binding protein [Natronorubrum texcoconense]
MDTWKSIASDFGGRRAIISLGVLYILFAIGLAYVEILRGDPVVDSLFISGFIGIPGVVLLLGGYWLPRTDVTPQFYPTITKWCLGAIGILGGTLTLYHFAPGTALSNPARALLAITAFVLVPAFAGGINDARSETRALELKRRSRQQQVVADLGQFALETDDLDEIMHEASRQLADVLDNRYCKVLDLDEERQELLLRQGVGWKDGFVGEATISAVEDDSQAMYTLENDHPIVVEDLETESRFSGPELLTSHNVRSGISTIIGPIDEPWGILGTHDVAPKSFTDEDVAFVQSVANVLAEAIADKTYQHELEQLVNDLAESNERLEQFAHAASHDLQEPLRMVSSYLQLIERRYEDELDNDGQEFLEFAVDGADRMSAMIDGLLQYSRVDSRGEPLEPIDLNDVVADVRRDLDPRIAESNAEVQIEELPCVRGDESQLRQVFQNLLKNAIDYCGDSQPRVYVSAEKNGTDWVVSVRDEGVGIDPAEQDRIFDVFHSHAPHDDHPGSGIGLALCERIVERHGGDIWVESEPGEGAIFSFTLPEPIEQELYSNN